MGLNTPDFDRREQEHRQENKELRQENKELRQENKELRQERDQERKCRQDQAAKARASKQPEIQERRQDTAMKMQAILKQQPQKRLKRGELAAEIRSRTPSGTPSSYTTIKLDVEWALKNHDDLFKVYKQSPGPRADYNRKREAPKPMKPITYVELTPTGRE